MPGSVSILKCAGASSVAGGPCFSKRISLMKKSDLEVGKFYYIKNLDDNNSKSLLEHIFIYYGRYTTCLASTSHLWQTLSDSDNHIELREISIKDLPLYIGWPKVDPMLAEIIKEGSV
jgi:hypothetical protein